MSGGIGEITAVDFRWYLDRVHGADYFRRWHRGKDQSGGLLVHKATHHFDLANWWVASHPATISALGSRRFYIPATADALGLSGHGERCHDCARSAECPYRLDLDDDAGAEVAVPRHRVGRRLRPRPLHLLERHQHRGHDAGAGRLRERRVDELHALCLQPVGGLRDRVLRDRGRAQPSPRGGARHLRRHAPRGRRRARRRRSCIATARSPGSWTSGQARATTAGETRSCSTSCCNPAAGDDPYRRRASHVDGAWSILTGIAANVAMDRGQTVNVADLLRDADIRL